MGGSSETSSERSKHSSRQQYSVEMKMSAISRMESGDSQEDIAADLQVSVSILAAWWIRRSDIKTNYVNKLANGYDDESPVKKDKQRSRSIDLKPVSNSVKVNAVKSILKGKSHQKVAKEIGVSPSQVNLWWKRKDQILRRNKRLSVDNENINKEANSNVKLDKKSPGKENVESSSKNAYTLEFKKQVINRIDAGESPSTVAKDLNLSESTVSVWWVRRSQINKRQRSSEIVSAPDSVETKNIEKNDRVEPASTIKSGETVEKVDHVTTDASKEEKTSSTDITESDQRPRSRRSVSSSVRTSTPVLTTRWCMPLEVKQSAIRRMETGVTQALVAKDLDVSLSTVAAWWRKKDVILGNSSNGENKVEEKIHEQNGVKSEPPTTSQIDDLGVFELEKLMTDDASSTDDVQKLKEIKETMIDDEIEKDKTVAAAENIEQSEKVLADNPTGKDLNEENVNPPNSNETQSIVNNSTGEFEEESREQITSTINEKENDEKYEINENQEGINPVKEDEDSSHEDDFDAEEEALLKLAEISHRDSTPRPQSVSSLSSTPRPQSGLQLILSYCSSDDEDL